MVGSDIVAHLQQHRAPDIRGQQTRLRKRLDVRSPNYVYIAPVFRRQYDHGVVDRKRIGRSRSNRSAELSWVGDDAGDCRGRCCFRADQVDLGVLGSAPALEVAVGSPKRHAGGYRRLSHAHTRAACAFEYTRPRRDKVRQRAAPRDRLQHLARAGRDNQTDVGRNGFAPEYRRHFRKVGD